MDRRLTRAERRACAFALPIALALGCSNIELVGVDRASVVEDGAAGELRADGASEVSNGDAGAPAAQLFDASRPDPRAEAGEPAVARDAAHDSAADGSPEPELPVWIDPARPAPRTNQFVDATLCPLLEPVEGAPCLAEALQCDYPVCWGRGSRSWVCAARRFTLWFDESFLCSAQRPCPATVPMSGAACSLAIECLYPHSCCKGPTGYVSVRCDGRWTVAAPYCGGCPATP